MSPTVVVLLLLAGLSEAAGRILPFLARRPATSRPIALGLLLTGALAEGTVFALWPLTASTIAEWTLPARPLGVPARGWTPSLVAPLLLAAVLAFPLLGPLLHLLLLVGVGARLAHALAEGGGLSWAAAAGCVAAAGIGLALIVGAVRRLVAAIVAPRTGGGHT